MPATQSDIAGTLVLEVDDLFPAAEALRILEFAELGEGSVKLTAAGGVFAHNATEERKRCSGSICSSSSSSPPISGTFSTSAKATAPLGYVSTATDVAGHHRLGALCRALRVR
jgi:hypothetical protein